MSLTDSWTALSTATATAPSFTVPRAVPAGSTIVLAVGRGGSGVVTAISSIRGNAWQILSAAAHSGGTVNETLALLRVTTALQAGDTFTVTGGSTNRHALVAGVFDDLELPVVAVVTPTSGGLSSSSQTVTSGSLATASNPRTLVVQLFAAAAGGFPATAGGGATLVDYAVTSAGSAERGVALEYKYDTATSRTSTINLGTAVVSVSAAAALKATVPASPPADPYAVSIFNGTTEVPATITLWNGTAEVPVTFELST